MSLTDSIPFYVTRKNADGVISDFTMSIWMQLLVILLVWLNIVGWSLYGLYSLVALAV